METMQKDAWYEIIIMFALSMVAMKALVPKPNALFDELRLNPSLHDERYASKYIEKYDDLKLTTLVLPFVENTKHRIIYQIREYEPLLDSSNMKMEDWARIAKDLFLAYESFDGFVILHGTDTLAYTASALSFMLENLGKTVVLTGSQIPLFETRTDGKDNFASALIIAGNYVIPEVCVYFANKLMRGNRMIKISSNNMDAFNTPNSRPIATFGLDLDIDFRHIFRPCKMARFEVHTNMSELVGILRIFPSISSTIVRSFLAPPLKGAVLQTFGSGNLPTNRRDMLDEIGAAVRRGVILVNCTQCQNGTVLPIYDTGVVLFDMGVIPGFDMTAEAALTKLSYLIGKTDLSLEMKKQMLQTNLRGELTSIADGNVNECDLLDAIARALNLTSPKELEQLSSIVYPAILNRAVVDGDLKRISNLKSYGVDMCAVNFDNRTALHLACTRGNSEVVKYLLVNGASVHMRDRYDHTPLQDAILNDNHEIIEVLVATGAHLTATSESIGEELCTAAANSNINRLESYRLAGSKLSEKDRSGRTALHLAALHGQERIVKYLLTHLNYSDTMTDKLGFTPLEYATITDQQAIVALLTKYEASCNKCARK